MTPEGRRGWGHGAPGTERPRWWPQDEPFPPARGEWPRMRGRFMRRFAVFFIGFILFFAFVVAAFVTLLIGAFSGGGPGLGAFGPMHVPGYDRPISEQGFADRVLYEVELKRPFDSPRKKFLIRLSRVVFDQLFDLYDEFAFRQHRGNRKW